jgi:hypothetical protein
VLIRGIAISSFVMRVPPLSGAMPMELLKGEFAVFGPTNFETLPQLSMLFGNASASLIGKTLSR